MHGGYLLWQFVSREFLVLTRKKDDQSMLSPQKRKRFHLKASLHLIVLTSISWIEI